MIPEENSPNRLLVEGKDDKFSIINLLARRGILAETSRDRFPFVHASGGKEDLVASIAVSAKTFKRLGIVIDADLELSNRWEEVKNQLNELNITVPNNPEINGTIVAGLTSESLIGVWLMPDNRNPGMLEDFLATLVPEEDGCWPFAKEVTLTAKEKGAPYPEIQKAKADIHTCLAWREEPGKPFGTALTARYLETNSEVAQSFVDWFRRLFLAPVQDG
jgi:hypothetical protein